MNESMTSPIILIFWLTHFNPRSYERSDSIPDNGLGQIRDVSIHAPTKGATCSLMSEAIFSSGFNPRSYERSDIVSVSGGPCYRSFNPRSYERSDLFFPVKYVK